MSAHTNTRHAEYRRYMLIGPGGMKCPCCAPSPGKTRKAALRAAKKLDRRQAAKDIDSQLMLDATWPHELKACVDVLNLLPALDPYTLSFEDYIDPDEQYHGDLGPHWEEKMYQPYYWRRTGHDVWEYHDNERYATLVVQWDGANQLYYINPHRGTADSFTLDHTHTLSQAMAFAETLHRLEAAV